MKQIANAHPLPPPSFDDDDGLLMFREIAESVTHSDKKKSVIAPMALRQEPKRRAWRKQYRFWLEDDKPLQCDLGWWIESLKASRTFTSILRNALCLYRELMEGQVDMLYQLFPDVKPPPSVPPAKIEDMQKKIDSLQDQVDLLKGILIKQSGPGAVDMTVKMAGNGAPLPTFTDDDDALVIRKDESSGERAAQNFLKSAFALQGKPSPVSKAPVVEAQA